jgi:glycine cleavage system transcriptional repressor
MTLLRGHFAMMLLCRGGSDAAQIERALAPLSAGGDLDVAVRPVTDAPAPAAGGSAWVLTVHGGDRSGIVSAVVAEVAAAGGNITDLTTRLAGELYLLVAEVDLPSGADAGALERDLAEVAADLGVGVTLRAAETDEL